MKKKSKLKSKFIAVNTPVISKKDIASVKKTLQSGWISSVGPEIVTFENKMAKFSKRKFASTVSSGTAALEIAVKALDLPKNSEIIMPSFTIVSNALAIIKNFCKPILVDTDLETWNIEICDIENKISKRTKAIMLPHIYGFPNDMDKILKIVKKYKLFLIEDASEMIGQKYKNKPCGSFGHISTYSFYANKHITTGEGGMVLTNDKKLDEKIKNLRNLCFGKINRFNHTDIGWNYRFTNIQASLGLSQLQNIKKIVKKKRVIGNFYYKKLKDNNKIIIQQPKLPYAQNIYWVFGILLKKNSKINASQLQKLLLKKHIQTRPFFWPMHKQTIFKKMGFFKKITLPNSEYLSTKGLYLPSGLNLKKPQLQFIVDSLQKILGKN